MSDAPVIPIGEGENVSQPSPSPEQMDVVVPTWYNSRVRLRPHKNADLELLYNAAVSPETIFRWRYRGTVPDPLDFVNSLKVGVLTQFIVETRTTADVVGLVTAYNANQRDGFVYVSALSRPRHFSTGLILDGVGLLMDYLFAVWPFRKLYFESIEFNSIQFASAYGSVLKEEGRLKEHTFYGDRWWDVVTSAVYRSDWLALRETGLNRATGLNRDAEVPIRKLVEDTSLTLDDFCELLEKEVPSPAHLVGFAPDHLLLDDLGYDSLGMLEIAAVIDELAGGVALEWPSEVNTIRDAYLLYTIATSLPKDDGPRET